MVDLDIFRKDIVNSTLNLMEKWSQSAENLIMGTAMQESHLLIGNSWVVVLRLVYSKWNQPHMMIFGIITFVIEIILMKL